MSVDSASMMAAMVPLLSNGCGLMVLGRTGRGGMRVVVGVVGRDVVRMCCWRSGRRWTRRWNAGSDDAAVIAEEVVDVYKHRDVKYTCANQR